MCQTLVRELALSPVLLVTVSSGIYFLTDSGQVSVVGQRGKTKNPGSDLSHWVLKVGRTVKKNRKELVEGNCEFRIEHVTLKILGAR